MLCMAALMQYIQKKTDGILSAGHAALVLSAHADDLSVMVSVIAC